MTQPTLNPEALKKAVATFAAEFNGTYSGEDLVASCIRTYLASLPPVDEGDLVERLQTFEIYRSETGKIGTHPLTLEAAAAIIALQGDVAEKNRLLNIALTETAPQRDEWKKRAEAAEARVAELERILEIGPDDDLTPRYPARRIKQEAERLSQVALSRALDAEAEVARLKDELAEAHRVIEPETLRPAIIAEVRKFEFGSAIPEYLADAILDIIRARSFRDGQKTGECATEGCDSPATVFFERGGVGSHYCQPCYLKIQALPAGPQKGASE